MSQRRPFLDRLYGIDESEAEELRNQLEKDVEQMEQMKALSKPVPSTPVQDDHLEDYLKFTKVILRKPWFRSDEVMKAEAFPEDFMKLDRNLRKFMIFVVKNIDPPLQATKKVFQYRDSLLFWTTRIFDERNGDPRRDVLLDSMTQAIRYMEHHYGKDDSG